MIAYLLLVVFSIIMVLVSLGLLIGGIIKKKTALWVSGLVAGIIFTLLAVFSIATYLSESIDYMGSEEYQEKSLKKAKNIGKSWGNKVSGVAEGVTETLNEDVIAALANKSAKIIGGSVTAMGEGFEDSKAKIELFSDESVQEIGLKLGRAQQVVDSTKYALGLFIEYQESFEGTLVLTAYDKDGESIDNAYVDVSGQKGEAKIEVFQFPFFRPDQTGYCILKKKEEE